MKTQPTSQFTNPKNPLPPRGAPKEFPISNCGLAGVKLLEMWGANLYNRTMVNRTLSKSTTAHGWKTDQVTRKTMIDTLASSIRREEIDCPDYGFWEEAQNFVVNQRGKPEAMPGEKDDAVMCAAIAFENMAFASKLEPWKRKKWTERDMLRAGGVAGDGFLPVALVRRP